MTQPQTPGTAPRAATGDWPPSLTGWRVVIIMLFCYALSYLDRQIISLLVEPIKKTLGASDTGIGLLQGPAFGLFYTLVGFPFGIMADRFHRVRLIAGGIILWCLMTAACGFAENFPQLFLARMGVGIGEAALVPAAVSLVSDLFHPDRRALPLATMVMGVALGSGAALVMGGAIIALAADGPGNLALVGPLVAHLQPWQAVFVIIGLGGLPLAAIVLTIKEPVRREGADGRRATADLPPLRETLRFMAGHRQFFGAYLGGIGLLYVHSYAVLAWMPSYFIRGFSWSAAETGAKLGTVVLICAMAGNFFSGVLVTFIRKRFPVDATLRGQILGAAVLAPLGILTPLADTPGLALYGAILLYLFVPIPFAVATATLTEITPNRFRAQVVAIYLLIAAILGYGLGPVLIGWLLDHVFQDPAAVGKSLAILSALVLPAGAYILSRALKPFNAARL